jgi:hypothetical protein
MTDMGSVAEEPTVRAGRRGPKFEFQGWNRNARLFTCLDWKTQLACWRNYQRIWSQEAPLGDATPANTPAYADSPPTDPLSDKALDS